MQNILSLVRSFTARVGIPSPTFVVASTDPQVQQILALLSEALEEIRTRGTWNELIREAVFTAVPGSNQGSITSLTSPGFEKILNETIFDRTRRISIPGPVSDRVWQGYQALPTTGPYIQYRIRGGDLLFYPPLGVNDVGRVCAFEYTVTDTVLDQDGVTWKNSITSDLDTLAFPDMVVLAALRWKWKYEKGLEYAEDFRRYEELVANALTYDGGKKTIRTDLIEADFRPGIFVPSGNWNLP